MSTQYGQIEREVHQLLANVAGSAVSDVETNYAAASTTTNRSNPDFAFTPVRDAIVDTIIEILLAIADTPRHPHWPIYIDTTSALGNGALRPTLGSTGAQILGAWGSVADFTTAKPCLPMPMDRVRDYNFYSSGIYSGLDVYWYAVDGERIYHTRTSVLVFLNVMTRPVFNAGSDIILYDSHVPAIVQGAAAKMAQKEGRYAALFGSADVVFRSHLAAIRTYQAISNVESTIIPSAK